MCHFDPCLTSKWHEYVYWLTPRLTYTICMRTHHNTDYRDMSRVLVLISVFLTGNNNARPRGASRAYNHRVPLLRARARQPRFGSSMQYCIRSLISITNAQKYCKRAKVCASLLLWHFKTIWIENICLLFIEVHCSNQQKPFHFAHRGFSYFLISTPNLNKWRPNVGTNIWVLTNALNNVVYENKVVYVHRKTSSTIFRYFDSQALGFGE